MGNSEEIFSEFFIFVQYTENIMLIYARSVDEHSFVDNGEKRVVLST